MRSLSWLPDQGALRDIRGDRGKPTVGYPPERNVGVKRFPALAPDVTRVLEGWCPDGWSEDDLRALESVRETVRDWVVKAAPGNPHVARRLLRTTAMLTLWAHRTLGTTDVRTVLDPRNVEYWVMKVNSHRSPVWRENARGALRAVGRAAYPAGWPPPPRGVGRLTIATPYPRSEEKAFVRAAKLAGRSNRAGRLWVVAGAFGGGLSGRELDRARVDDLVDMTSGRLAIRARGPKARLVPFRKGYTKLVRQAVNATRGNRFVTTTGVNSVYQISGGLDTGDGEGLSLRRARSTWLQAHLVAGTPLAALRRVAGPISANTLDALLQDAAASIDDTQAVLEALCA